MSLYDVAKLMSETRRLAAEYRRTTGQTLPVTSEVARFDGIQLLGLKDIESDEPGIDALKETEQGVLKVQIKGRALFGKSKGSLRIGQLNMTSDWQIVLLVLLDESYEPLEILENSREVIEKALQDSNPNKRGSMTVAKFRALGKSVWKPEEVKAQA